MASIRNIQNINSMPSGKEKGAVLVVALIFLVLITILALTSSASSMLQLGMSGNLRSAQQAKMSANTALRGVEWQLWTSAVHVGGHLTCIDGALSSDGCVKFNPQSATYSSSGSISKFKSSESVPNGIGITYTMPGSDWRSDPSFDTAKLAAKPRYIIEDMGRIRPPGTGVQREGGDTGPATGGAGQLNLHIYRITARATGGSENSGVILQSTFSAQTSN